MKNPGTILFITGAFVSHTCWDEWRTYFEQKGYKTLAPPWPHKDGSASELRNRRPHDTALAALTLKECIDSYAEHARSLPEKPIIIGHSTGGLITQILVNRNLASAGVAIHSLPPQGVIPYEFSFLKAATASLGIFTSLKKTYLMSFKKWQYAFMNEMPLEEQKVAYEKLLVPESKKLTRGALTSAAKVDFKKPHVPLLFTSGDMDNLIPASLNRRNYKRYKNEVSIVDYKDFPGRRHYVLGQSTWKEDADYIIDWLNQRVTGNDETSNLQGTQEERLVRQK